MAWIFYEQPVVPPDIYVKTITPRRELRGGGDCLAHEIRIKGQPITSNVIDHRGLTKPTPSKPLFGSFSITLFALLLAPYCYGMPSTPCGRSDLEQLPHS